MDAVINIYLGIYLFIFHKSNYALTPIISPQHNVKSQNDYDGTRLIMLNI